MQRDPFYREIVDGLKGPLDGELFEQCAADLLRVYHPLVPIRGGSDAGMDGAIADNEGEPFPLVTTTSEDAIGNLTRNLARYKEEGGTRRKAVFATARELTTRKRQNLLKRARELGFILIQVYDQDAFANLLYRSPAWCMELLGLSGKPAALSVIPKTTRPLLFDQPLIGRDKEYEWLSNAKDDKLLVGQPGSGKTFLLYRLALEGDGLFVISSDRGELAAAIRVEQPAMLFVDDAGGRLELIAELRHIRSTIGADFSILAACWPGDRDYVEQELSIVQTGILELPQLTRDEVVEVVKGTGLHGPSELIGYIVDQAEGRPGLAVTFAHLCIQGLVKEVLYGDVLQRDVIRFFEPYVGKKAQVILAGLSVGGDMGMEMEAVAYVLGLPLLDMWEILTHLAAGGVIVERRLSHPLDVSSVNAGRVLAVRPDALRHALVRDVFFGGATPLSFQTLLELIRRAPLISHVAETLMGAKARGGMVPEALLQPLIEQAGDDLTYQRYASIGQSEALWVLQQHPEKLIAVARLALSNAPDATLPPLLTAAIGDVRPLNSTLTQPLRLIKDWTLAGEPGTGEALQRRQVLFDGTLRWLNEGGDIGVALQAFCIALSPAFEATSTDPGFGATLTLYRGCIALDEIDQLQQLWDEFWNVIAGRDAIDWRPILDILHTWAYPSLMFTSGKQPSAEAREIIRRQAVRVMEGVAESAKEQPGVLRQLERYVTVTGADVEISSDSTFNILYPKEDREDWQAARKSQANAVAVLARKWHQRDPEAVVVEVAAIDREAELARVTWPQWTEYLYAEISRHVDDHVAWCRTLVRHNTPANYLAPLLQQAAAGNEQGWLEVASACLEEPDLRWPAIALALTQPELSPELYARALEHVAGYAHGVGSLCGRGMVPEHVLRRLLEHESGQVAMEAAQGEWRVEPEKSVRESVRDVWRLVVVSHASDEYWLKQIFEADSELARSWLLARMTDDSLSPIYSDREDNSYRIAVQAQNNESRVSLLTALAALAIELPGNRFRRLRWVALLVGDELPLYRQLLAETRLKDYHLAPLMRGFNDDAHDLLDRPWVGFAMLAFEAGYTPEDVFGATQPVFYSWSGPISNMYARWARDFEALLLSDSEDIRRVGELGVAWANANRGRELEKEHREAVYGLR